MSVSTTTKKEGEKGKIVFSKRRKAWGCKIAEGLRCYHFHLWIYYIWNFFSHILYTFPHPHTIFLNINVKWENDWKRRLCIGSELAKKERGWKVEWVKQKRGYCNASGGSLRKLLLLYTLMIHYVIWRTGVLDTLNYG
jgi:hypothetical protein